MQVQEAEGGGAAGQVAGEEWEAAEQDGGGSKGGEEVKLGQDIMIEPLRGE